MEIVIGILIAGLVGAVIGQMRGRTNAGFWWGLILGPIGWLTVMLGPNLKKAKEDEMRRAQDRKMQDIQEAHLSELRALRGSLGPTDKKPEIKEDMYWVNLKDRELGPVDKLELIELYTGGKISLDTPVALDTESGVRAYRMLSAEVPALKWVKN